MFDKKLIITELATNAAGKTIPLSLNTKLFEIAERYCIIDVCPKRKCKLDNPIIIFSSFYSNIWQVV